MNAYLPLHALCDSFICFVTMRCRVYVCIECDIFVGPCLLADVQFCLHVCIWRWLLSFLQLA